MAGHRERRSGEARRTELEAARIDVARRMTARAVAVEAAHGEVIGWRGQDRKYGIGGNAECPGDVRAMAGETPGDPLVDSGDRIEGEVARGHVALRAGGGGGNVIRRLRRRRQQSRSERRRLDVTGAAIGGGG